MVTLAAYAAEATFDLTGSLEVGMALVRMAVRLQTQPPPLDPLIELAARLRRIPELAELQRLKTST